MPQGDELTVTITGVEVGEDLELWAESTPLPLGTHTVGSVPFKFTFSTSKLAPGSHTFYAKRLTAPNEGQVLSVPFTVTIPNTGADGFATLGALAVVLGLSGAALMLSSRRATKKA